MGSRGASTLVARGHNAQTIGTVNAVEFFVTLAASVTFLLTLGLTHWPVTRDSPSGESWPLRSRPDGRIPVKPLMIAVGVLVMALSLRTLLRP